MTSHRGRTQQACHVASAAGTARSGNGRGNKGTELTVKGVAPEGVHLTVYSKTGLDSIRKKNLCQLYKYLFFSPPPTPHTHSPSLICPDNNLTSFHSSLCKRLFLPGKLSSFHLVVCRYLLSVAMIHLQGIEAKRKS